jgi:hypothetical protein
MEPERLMASIANGGADGWTTKAVDGQMTRLICCCLYGNGSGLSKKERKGKGDEGGEALYTCKLHHGSSPIPVPPFSPLSLSLVREGIRRANLNMVCPCHGSYSSAAHLFVPSRSVVGIHSDLLDD